MTDVHRHATRRRGVAKHGRQINQLRGDGRHERQPTVAREERAAEMADVRRGFDRRGGGFRSGQRGIVRCGPEVRRPACPLLGAVRLLVPVHEHVRLERHRHRRTGTVEARRWQFRLVVEAAHEAAGLRAFCICIDPDPFSPKHVATMVDLAQVRHGDGPAGEPGPPRDGEEMLHSRHDTVVPQRYELKWLRRAPFRKTDAEPQPGAPELQSVGAPAAVRRNELFLVPGPRGHVARVLAEVKVAGSKVRRDARVRAAAVGPFRRLGCRVGRRTGRLVGRRCRLRRVCPALRVELAEGRARVIFELGL
mmetsp:Transcript_10214/g.35402  ORF Transcript_10214/g.35402 Transcript_10214/m.35402 type:complete len:307 (+) Transcript_10214:2049-2969(+)